MLLGRLKSFKIKDFINGKPDTHIEFYDKFFEDKTSVMHQMFSEFIDLRGNAEQDKDLRLRHKNFEVRCLETAALALSKRSTETGKDTYPLMECDMEFEQVIKREYLSSPDCLLYPFMDKEEDLRRSFIYYHRSNSRRDRTLNIRQEFCYRIVPAFRLRLFE